MPRRADDEGTIVGHVMLSTAHVGAETVLGLGPIAVDPARQNEGIGSALMREAIARANATGYPLIGLLGHPAYYPRFGFEPAEATFGITTKYDAPPEAWMALALPAYEPRSAAASATPKPSADATGSCAPWRGCRRAHRAPGARVVAREVVERPAAVVGGADLQPLPGAVGGRASDDRQRPPYRAGGPQPRRPVRCEGDGDAASRESASSVATASASTGSPLCESSSARSASRSSTTGSSATSEESASPCSTSHAADSASVRPRRRTC